RSNVDAGRSGQLYRPVFHAHPRFVPLSLASCLSLAPRLLPLFSHVSPDLFGTGRAVLNRNLLIGISSTFEPLTTASCTRPGTKLPLGLDGATVFTVYFPARTLSGCNTIRPSS